MQPILAQELRPHTVKGARSLDISAVSEWVGELERALNSGAGPLHLDLSAVERIDTACLQALAAFVLSAREQHITLVWQGKSPAFQAAVEDVGLDSFFGVTHG